MTTRTRVRQCLGLGKVALVAAFLCTEALSQTIDDFDTWMQTIEAKTHSVQQAIGDKRAPAATADAKALQEAFALVETFLAKRGDAADGVAWSKQAQAQARDLETAIAASDFDAAQTHAVAVAATCTPCHRLYRPLP